MKMQVVQVNIESLSSSGKGLGFFSDASGSVKEAEIPFCMPGDLVSTQVHRKKRGVFPGRLLEVLQGSKERILPKCMHFGTCGGCSFQEMKKIDQLSFKQNQVAKEFDGLMEPRPILHIEKSYEYRNKMEFSFTTDKQGNRFLGLFIAGARGKVFNVQECHLVSPWFSQILEKVRVWWSKTELKAFHPSSGAGSLRTLTLRESATTKERLVMLTVSGDPAFALHEPELNAFKELFDDSYSVFLRIHQAIKGQPTEFYEMHLKGPEFIVETMKITLDSRKDPSVVHFQVSPTSFFQPNTESASLLYNEALRLAELKPDDVVYDLYCGTGTLGLLSARFVKSVFGIEISFESSLDARENAKRNGIENVEILTGSVGDVLKNKPGAEKPTVILLDPPRSGLDPSSLQEVLLLNSPKIVYISCNPNTQSRDVKAFLAAGYLLSAVQPVDQFPQTPHIENIAILHRKNL